MMKARAVCRIAAIAMSLACALDAQAQQQIASVNKIEPQGTRQQRQGTPVALALGSGLFSNDVVETSPKGRLDLAFADGSRISVGPASQITLDDYVYRPGSRGASAALGVAKGAMRFISGKVQRDGVRITTPTATIGIRGTDFLVMVMPDGATRVRVDGGVIRVWACGAPRTTANAYVTEVGHTIAIDASCAVSVTVNEASTNGSASPSTAAAAAAPSTDAAAPAADAAAAGGPGNGNGNGGNASGGGNTGGTGPGSGNGGANAGQGEGAANGGGGSGAASGGGTGGGGAGGAGGGAGGAGGGGGGGGGGGAGR